MSLLNVNKVDPSTGTDLEIGTSGDTITVPTGAGLTVTDEVKTNKISPATGTAFTMGDSGDTFTVPSGATIVNSGTATGFSPSVTPDNWQYFIMGSNQTLSADAATTISGWGSTEITADLLYNLGTQYVSHSSGIFSFSTEGYYKVAFRCSGSTAGTSDSSGYINITTNDSAYSDAVDCNFSKSTGAGFNFYMDGIFKITDTSNHKLSTSIYAATNDVTVSGNTTRQRTYIRFERLGTAS